jgi:tRNA-Thr(GGU) m(6)t(6)A37 methyltransferase TsaA
MKMAVRAATAPLTARGDMNDVDYSIQPIGFIRSPLVDLDAAPRQGDEAAPDACIELTDAMAPGLLGMRVGEELLVLTWLHLAERDVLQVHPRGAPGRRLTGVFTTRSPDRPNPIGLHRVSVLEIDGGRLRVAPMEAVDGTPVLDIKCVLTKVDER